MRSPNLTTERIYRVIFTLGKHLIFSLSSVSVIVSFDKIVPSRLSTERSTTNHHRNRDLPTVQGYMILIDTYQHNLLFLLFTRFIIFNKDKILLLCVLKTPAPLPFLRMWFERAIAFQYTAQSTFLKSHQSEVTCVSFKIEAHGKGLPVRNSTGLFLKTPPTSMKRG